MVRFSKALERRRKEKDQIPSPEEDIQIEKFRIHDFPASERGRPTVDVTEDEIGDAQEPSDTFLAERYGETVKRHFNGLLERAKDIRDRVSKDQKITPSPVLSVLRDVIDGDAIEQLYEYAVLIPNEGALPLHAVSVTLASLKVGKGMGYDKEKLLRLGLAAFLENVGMYKIPEHIRKKNGKLSAEEIAIIKRHPEISAQMLSGMGETFEWLAAVALQVHERWDGSGYPMGLKGEQISELASIIGVIDTYLAMVNNRPYRAKFIQTEAVKSLIDSAKGKFPPRVFKEFLDQISLFPVNAYVKLNNRSIGRVLSTDKKQPLRPTIELLYDGLGQKMEKRKVIHLSKAPLLHIVQAVDARDFPG